MQRWLDSLISPSSSASLDKKGFRQFHFTTCAILFLLMKQGILILCLKVRRLTMRKCTLPVLPEIHTRPTDESSHLLQPDSQCFQLLCLCCKALYWYSSGLLAASQRWSLGFFCHSLLLLWSSSFTDKKWRMSSIYSAMHHLESSQE